MRRTILRDYQWIACLDLFGHLLDGERYLGLFAPMGSGKTTISGVLLARLFETDQGFRCAVVVTPQVHIEAAFATLTGEIHVSPDQAEGSSSLGGPWDLRGLWEQPRVADTPSREIFKSHLQGNPTRPVLLTSHQALVHWRDLIPEDTTGMVLAIDESQHVGVTKKEERAVNELSKIAAMWHDRGGVVIHMTATPSRKQGKTRIPTIPSFAVIHRRSMAEHARSGYAPRHLQARRLTLDYEAGSLSDFHGETTRESENETGNSFTQIVELWDLDGRPKTVIIVPVKGSKKWRDRMIAAFQKRHPEARIFDAVGASTKKQRELRELLDREREVTDYIDSEVDIIIACRRFDEGTDWPLCSHVYNIGLPRSMTLILQRWGRTFRDKKGIANYPEEHIEVGSITFFAPRMSQSLRKAYEEHHEQALLMSAFLADYETAEEYANGTAIFASAGLGTKPKDPDGQLRWERLRQALILGEEQQALARLKFAEIRERMPEATAPEVWKLCHDLSATWEPDIFFGICLRFADECLGKDSQFAAKWRKQVTGIFKKYLRQGVDRKVSSARRLIRQELIEAFAEVAKEYDHITVGVDETLRHVHSTITGATAEEVSSKLKARLPKGSLSVAKIRRGAYLWMLRNNPPEAKAEIDAYFEALEESSPA